MPIQATSMETASKFDRLRLAIIGADKTGKSRLAATGRKPILHLDFDNRKESLAGLKGVYSLTFAEPPAGQMPTVYNEVLTICAKLEKGYTLKQIGADLGVQDWPDVKPRTLIDDSLFSLGRFVSNHILYSNKDLRRELVYAGGKLQVRGSRDFWNFEMPAVEDLIARQLGIPGLDVIIIFHEQAEEADASTDERRIYTGRVDVYPGRYRNICKWFNEVWRVTRPNDQPPIVQMQPDMKFTASTNLDFSKVPKEKFKPDVEYMINLALQAK